MKTGELVGPFAKGRALVLGARDGNIGGVISDYLSNAAWNVWMDDCQADNVNRYEAPPPLSGVDGEWGVPYRTSEVCVITTGVTHMEPFSEVSKVDLRKVLYGSLELPLECARRYVQEREPMIERHHSTIIFIGSYAQDHPFTHCTSYCTAKAGLNMAAQSLAWELMPEGFHVHIINPNHVAGTPMTEQVLKGMQDGTHKMTERQAFEYQNKDLYPRMGRILDPVDIAQMVKTILDNPALGWVSGQPINMYGGVR